MSDRKVIPISEGRKSGKWVPVLDAHDRPIKGFSVYVPTGMIYYRETFKGLGFPTLFKPTGETTIGRAKTAAKLMSMEWVRRYGGTQKGSAGRKAGIVTVQEVIQDVLTRYTPKQRPATRLKHDQFFREIGDHFGRYDISSITAREVEGWIRDLKRTKKRKTFADYIKHWNLLTRWAYNERHSSHLVRFKNPNVETSKPGRVYTSEEIKSLWKVMNEETRDQFVLCYECMMRLREALYLTWDRLDLKTGKVTLRAQDVKTGSKTKKGREFILSPHALERMRARAKRMNPCIPWVFPSPNNVLKPVESIKTAWKSAKDNARIQGLGTWHHLRHSGLTKALLEVGVPPIQVSEYAGVSMQTIQRVYLHSRADHTKATSLALSVFGSGSKRGVNGVDDEA